MSFICGFVDLKPKQFFLQFYDCFRGVQRNAASSHAIDATLQVAGFFVRKDSQADHPVGLGDMVVSADGTIGYGHKIHHVTGTNARGDKIEITVRISDVYLKQHGDWVIVQEHVSVPLDAKTMTPDLMSRP